MRYKTSRQWFLLKWVEAQEDLLHRFYVSLVMQSIILLEHV